METMSPASLQLDGAVGQNLSSLQLNTSASKRSLSDMAHKTPLMYVHFPMLFLFSVA